MRTCILFTLSYLFLNSFVSAAPLLENHLIPETSVEKYGQMILNNDRIQYQVWQTKDLKHKVQIIQAIAGRSSAKELNAPMIEAIKKANFPQNQYQTTTIIDQNDSIWGTGSFVKLSAENSKKEFPWSSFVLDANGVVAKAWNLKQESSAIILVDQKGMVKFAKQGPLSPIEIKKVIELTKKLIQTASSSN